MTLIFQSRWTIKEFPCMVLHHPIPIKIGNQDKNVTPVLKVDQYAILNLIRLAIDFQIFHRGGHSLLNMTLRATKIPFYVIFKRAYLLKVLEVVSPGYS